MHEIALVKNSHQLDRRSADQHASTGDPLDRDIVLRQLRTRLIETSKPGMLGHQPIEPGAHAEYSPRGRDVAAASALFRTVEVQNQGSRRTCIFVLLKRQHQSSDHIGLQQAVRIQDQDIVPHALGYADIAARRKAEIGRHLKDLQTRIVNPLFE